jgi:hypothetical protein
MRTINMLVLLLLLRSAHLSDCTHHRSMLQYEAQYGSQTDQADTASASVASSSSNTTGSFNLTLVVDAVHKAMNEPIPFILKFKTEFEANGSSIAVAESYAANTLAVQVGACMHAQPSMTSDVCCQHQGLPNVCVAQQLSLQGIECLMCCLCQGFSPSTASTSFFSVLCMLSCSFVLAPVPAYSCTTTAALS